MRLSSDPAARRRLAALAAIALAALTAGVLLGALLGGDDPGSEAPDANQRAAAAGLSLEQQVGQLLVLSFPGQTLPASVRTAFRERRAAGAILFGGNVASPGQVRRLTRQLQDSAGGAALIATDQEGGDIRIIHFAAPAEPQSALSSPAAAGAAARDAGEDLRRLGINVNLAPIADVGAPGSPLAGRFYPGDGRQVAASIRRAVPEYARAHVGATVKHFPGFGSAEANTDDAPVTIETGRGAIEREDLEPFRAAIAERVPLVMVSHALYPDLDRVRIASQSPAVIGGLLRGKLGYEGLVITDSLEAEAVTARSSLGTAAVRSIEAGADLLLLTGSGSYTPVRRRLLERARSSARFRSRIEQALERVRDLRARIGLPASVAAR